MIKVNYTELDGPAGPTCRLEASGHAGYAPAGQDIVCAGASTLMQTLCALLAGEEELTDPMLLTDMDKACARILDAIDRLSLIHI